VDRDSLFPMTIGTPWFPRTAYCGPVRWVVWGGTV